MIGPGELVFVQPSHATPPEPAYFSLCTMLDEHETDVFAKMMEYAHINGPSNMVRTALFFYAKWAKIEGLHHDDFQLRRTAPALPRIAKKDAPV